MKVEKFSRHLGNILRRFSKEITFFFLHMVLGVFRYKSINRHQSQNKENSTATIPILLYVKKNLFPHFLFSFVETSQENSICSKTFSLPLSSS